MQASGVIEFVIEQRSIQGALLLLAGGLSLFAVVLAARHTEAADWRRSLVTFKLTMPAGLTADDVAAWLSGLAASTHAPRWSLLPFPPAMLEIRATSKGIEHFLLVPKNMRATALSTLRAALPAVRTVDAEEYFERRPVVQLAAEAILTSHRRPLAAERAAITSRAVLASLQPLASGQTVVLQWILTGAGTPPPVRASQIDSASGGLPWWLEAQSPRDADDLRAERLKHREPLLHGSLRLGVAAADKAARYAVFGRTWGTLRGQNAAGVQVVRRWWLPPSVAARRLNRLALPLVSRWPFLINVQELVGLLGFPLGDVHLPGLPRTAARQLPPPSSMPMRGLVVGLASYTGMADRALALKTEDRLRHVWCIGPTGTGKSTLLANMIGQDIAAGRGVAVLDPKGDLVADVLARLPDERHEDVVVVSPSQTAYPIGLNVLNTGHGEHARELAVDALVHLMASLWRSSFGPRTADVLRNALLTLTHTHAVDGSAHTLLELPEVLLNPRFRSFVLGQSGVPEMVRPFWAAYEQMRDVAQAQVIGPSLNKLRSFTTRTALRLMLGQSQGVRLDELFTKRRVFLFDLSKGSLGAETTALVGSLVMAGLWQATLERVVVPHDWRHPAFVYLDEFQDFLRLPVDLADMLAQSRGLGVGLVLAHQYLGQLTEDVRTAVLGTARTQIAFQVEYDDAGVLANRFAPLTRADLTSLAAYEVALRPCIDGMTMNPVTGHTLPLGDPTADGAGLALASQQRFGISRADAEAAIRARTIASPGNEQTFGRARREAES